MLSGSAILRVAVLIVAAALLAGLFRLYWPYAGDAGPVTPPVSAPTTETRPEPRPAEARAASPPPLIDTKSPPASAPPPSQAPEPGPVASRAAEPTSGFPSPSPPQRADPVSAPPPVPSASLGQEQVAAAGDAAGPRALSVADLNTATAAELNRLRGGGMIGRAIIQRRPYASVDQLLSKRVLSRGTYERIKDQVTVR